VLLPEGIVPTALRALRWLRMRIVADETSAQNASIEAP
jgi:hypothetical protein